MCGMAAFHRDIKDAIDVFVRGFCAGKSRTHPYEFARVESLWVMRDAPRRSPRDYRREEWIAYGVEPRTADAIAREHTRGRYFICAIHGMDEPGEQLKQSYKAIGYRLLTSEPLFVHRLARIPRTQSPVKLSRVTSREMAQRFGKETRTRPIAPEDLGKNAPFRQYVAVDDGAIIGWVRSIDAAGSTWCSDMYVRPSHRRRDIGKTLLGKMLRDDRARGAKRSVLLSSHAGALLYPRVGYEQIGELLAFVPKRK